ncbi:hypothetical protein [Methylobacterium sp. CM6247]
MRHRAVEKWLDQKGFVVLERRWVVERTFGWLTHWGGPAARARWPHRRRNWASRLCRQLYGRQCTQQPSLKKAQTGTKKFDTTGVRKTVESDRVRGDLALGIICLFARPLMIYLGVARPLGQCFPQNRRADHWRLWPSWDQPQPAICPEFPVGSAELCVTLPETSKQSAVAVCKQNFC